MVIDLRGRGHAQPPRRRRHAPWLFAGPVFCSFPPSFPFPLIPGTTLTQKDHIWITFWMDMSNKQVFLLPSVAFRSYSCYCGWAHRLKLVTMSHSQRPEKPPTGLSEQKRSRLRSFNAAGSAWLNKGRRLRSGGPPTRARRSDEDRTRKDTCQCLCTKDRLFIFWAVVLRVHSSLAFGRLSRA